MQRGCQQERSDHYSATASMRRWSVIVRSSVAGQLSGKGYAPMNGIANIRMRATKNPAQRVMNLNSGRTVPRVSDVPDIGECKLRTCCECVCNDVG